MDHQIFERAIQKRKDSVEHAISSAEVEYRELVAEVRVYNDAVYSCMEKEFRTVKTLSKELERASHVTREKKKRTGPGTVKKRLAQNRGHKIASKSGPSSKSASKLSTKQKDVGKAKHKSPTSKAVPSSIPGTHLTPLSDSAKGSTEDGIDAILATGKPAEKALPKASNAVEASNSSSMLALAPPPVRKLPNGSGSSKITSAPVHKMHSSASVTSKVTSPKGKHDGFGALSFNKGLKRDVQLFTILDTTVSPPLPRYIAKIVPESTALIPLSSSARNLPKIGSTLTTLASTHSSISSTHSTSSPAPSVVSSAHSRSTLNVALAGSLSQNKSTAAGSKSVHKDTTSVTTMKSSITAPKRSVITPVTPPTVYACDQPGCRESFSQVEMLNLHKLTFHRLVLPQLMQPIKEPVTRYNGSLTRTGQEVVAATARTPIDGSKKIIEKVGSKRVRCPSGPQEDSGHKFAKLDSGKSSPQLTTSSLHSTAPKPWRNFARKSTGRSRSFKRKIVFVNRMQLKLTKISTKGRKMLKRTVNQVKRPNLEPNRPNWGPLSHYTTPHGYRNPEFFRNLIRSQLKLPITNQKATATSDYISLQPDAKPSSVEQTNKTFPGPAPVCEENEDSVCSRALPFIGNCARTRKFTPEVFSRPKKLTEQDRIVSSPSLSTSTSIMEETQVPSSSSEDETFSLVELSSIMSQQQPSKDNSDEVPPPKLAAVKLRAASPQPLSMYESTGGDVEWEGMAQSPPELEKIQKETRISVDPLPSVVPTKPASPVVKSTAVMSPVFENSEYTMRLLQTIAKLSGDTSVPQPPSVTGEKSRKSSVRSPPPPMIETGESSDLEDEPCTSLVIGIDLSRLSRVPVPPPCPSQTEVGVFTHRLGSFTSRGAQVERGLIIDSDDLERRLTVRVNEALCEMKEKLQKTERRVREVMKEKEQLEKILEAKLKMIKDLTTTGIKPVFADKETMTEEFTGNKKQVKSKMRSISTQTVISGPPWVERRAAGASKCLSRLGDKELEQYLGASPPPSADPSEDDDAIDVTDDMVPASSSSKNKWMFESSDTARCSAFNLQVRFMRALMENTDGQNESTPRSLVSSSLLSRDLCSTFTKIQHLNQQLQVLPLVSVLKEKVDIVTSNVNHLLSHLPLPKGGDYEDLVLLMKLSVGTSAYNVGWKMKELLALLGDINADRLPAYFKAELKLVTKHVQNALQFGEFDMKNVTVDHTLRPVEQAPVIRLIDDDLYDSGDFDLDDILSSSDDDSYDDDDNDDDDNKRPQRLNKEGDEVEVGGDRNLVAKRPRPATTLVQLGSRHNGREHDKHRRRRREKRTHSTRESRLRPSPPSPGNGKVVPVKGKSSLMRGYGGRFVKTSKLEKSKVSKTSEKVPSAAVSRASNSLGLSAAAQKKVARLVGGRMNSHMPLILKKPTAVVNTPSKGGSSVTVTPIQQCPSLPNISSSNYLSEPIKLLTSLAATMISKGIPVGKAVTTSTASISQPQVTQSTNSAASSMIGSPKRFNSVGTDTISGACTSGRVETSNLSSNTFTPIVKAMSPTSTSPSGPVSLTTLTSSSSSSKSQPVSAVTAAPPQPSQVQFAVLPNTASSSVSSVGSQAGMHHHRANTAVASSLTFGLSSSTLPPAVIAASSLLSLPPGPWNHLPISLPPSIVTASAIPALQKSARQVRTQGLTNAPAPLMRSSIVNSFPLPSSLTSRLAMPSITSPPSVNMAPHFSLPLLRVAAKDVTQLFSMPTVVPPSGTVASSFLTTPTSAPPSDISSASTSPMATPLATPMVTPPPIVAAALSCTPSAQAVMESPSVDVALSSSTAPASSLMTTTVSEPSSISLESPNPGVNTTSSASGLPSVSDASASVSETSTSPVLSSTIISSIAAATPTTCTVTPVEGLDLLPDLPETNNSTTVVVIDPSPSPESARPPLSPSPATAGTDNASAPLLLPSSTSSDAAAPSSSRPVSSPTPLVVSNASSSDSTDSESNPVEVNLPSSKTNSVEGAELSLSSSSLPKAPPPSLLEEILSSSSALLTSIAAQGQNTQQSAITTVSPSPRCDSSLAFLEPQRFKNLLAHYYTCRRSMANREQSMSQGIQTLSSTGAHRLRRSPRIQNQAGISPSVAALKASIFKNQRNTPQRKASAPSSTKKDSSTQDSHRLVSLSPSPLTDTCVNSLTTTLNANPTIEDLKMMYSPQTPPTDSTTTMVSTTSSSSTPIIVIDDDDKCTEMTSSSEKVTTECASVSPPTTSTLPQANPTTSTASASPSESSISTPPISTAASTPQSDDGSTPVSREVSPKSPFQEVSNGCSVGKKERGLRAQDVTPLVQVLHDEKGVLIKWTLPKEFLRLQDSVTIYELYAYIKKGGGEEAVPPVSEWSQVGRVKPLKLPMAVTLTNVVKTKKYFFSVRALFGSETCATQFSKPSSFQEDVDTSKFVAL